MDKSTEILDLFKFALTPVALISGVGLLLLVISNRLGRTIDATRILIEKRKQFEGWEAHKLDAEIKILYKRSRFLRTSVLLIAVSIISSCLMIPVIMISIYFDHSLDYLNTIFFIISILAILISSIFLFLDILLALKALKFEIEQHLNTRLQK